MEEKKFRLSPDAFNITPDGEVVINSPQLAEALRAAQETSIEDVTSGTGRICVFVQPSY